MQLITLKRGSFPSGVRFQRDNYYSCILFSLGYQHMCICIVCFVSRHGRWIIDDFPKTIEQWNLLLDSGKNLPDTVIYLHDESPNGDFLTQRYYSMKKVDIDERIRQRKDQEENVEGYFHFQPYFVLSKDRLHKTQNVGQLLLIV